jgi:hypothetical protein
MSPVRKLIEQIDLAIDRSHDRIQFLRWHVSRLELSERDSDGARRVLARRELDLKRRLLHRAVLASHPRIATLIQPELLDARPLP